jgi:hypothetical protein
MFYCSVDLPCKRIAVRPFNDAKHRALVRIAQRQCDDFGRDLPRPIGRHSGRFEQFCYSQPNNGMPD